MPLMEVFMRIGTGTHSAWFATSPKNKVVLLLYSGSGSRHNDWTACYYPETARGLNGGRQSLVKQGQRVQAQRMVIYAVEKRQPV